MARVVVLGNPTSGGGRGGRAIAHTAAGLRGAGHDVTRIVGQDAASALEIADAALRATGPDRLPAADALVVVGGDGAVHLGITLCLRHGLPLGIVPVGSGNDFAAALGLPAHQVGSVVAPLAQALREGSTRSVDVARLSGGTSPAFGAILACGFDALVNRRANGWRWRSPLKYPAAVMRELPTFRPISYEVQFDGARRRFEAMLLAVANTPSYGGNLRIIPSAQIDDGLLDIAILHPMSKPEFLRLFATLDRGTHVHHPRVEIVQAREVTVSTPAAVVTGFADGEPVGTLPLRAVVDPGALRVLDCGFRRVG